MRWVLGSLAMLWMAFSVSSVQAVIAVGPNSPPLVAGDPTLLDARGWAVDISGDRAVVGTGGGAQAFVFDVNSGELLTPLIPDPRFSRSLYGYSVAIEGDLAVVAVGQSNAAYLFDVNTGQQLHRFEPVSDSRFFVRSVSISDGLVALGMPHPESGNDHGAVFVYDIASRQQLYRIDGPTNIFKRYFGATVAIEGDTLAVRSPSAFDRQDVYVYDAHTGQPRWSYGHATDGTELTVKDVVIDGDYVVVGAGERTFDMPEALVFDRVTGELLDRIDIRVPNENDDYRSSLDVSGDRLVVGSWGTYYEGYGYYVGDAYAFDLPTGELLGRIPNPVAGEGADFAYSVAIDGDRVVVGSSNGRTYAYTLVPEPAAACLAALLGGGALVRRPRRR